MNAKEFVDSLLKNTKKPMPDWLLTLARDIRDTAADDLYERIYETSPAIGYLYEDLIKPTDTIEQMVEKAWKAFEELERIMTTIKEIDEGEWIDQDEFEKEAQDNEWSEEQREHAYWDEIQTHWDAFREDIEALHGKEFWETFQKDRSLEWQYDWEIPRILARKEEALGEQINLGDDDYQDWIINSLEYDDDIDLDKPIKPQIIVATFAREE